MDLLTSLVVRRQGKEAPAYTSIDGRECRRIAMACAAEGPSSSQGWEALLLSQHSYRGPELDYLAAPPSAQDVRKIDNDSAFEFGGMPDLQSIDDFERENPYTPRPKLVPVISRKSNPEHAVKFQHLCDQHGVLPEWTIEGTTAQGFLARVQIGTESITIDEPQPNKKLAKEEVCKLAIARMPQLPFDQMDGVVRKRGTKRKSESAIITVDKSENWIGTLNEYAQQEKLPLPEWQEYQAETVPVQFVCTVSIAGSETQIGVDLGPLPSKKDAKAAAAREAVLFLRAQGKLPETPSKRQQTTSLPAPVLPGHTGLTQAVQHIDFDGSPKTTLPQRVHLLTASLGFNTPRLVAKLSLSGTGEPIPGNSSFYDVALYFDERDTSAEPRLRGPIGQVERVHGKDKAREACYGQVLTLLEAIQSERSSV